MKRHASMNRIYRLVWSRVQNAWIAVSENARGRGKSGRTRLLSRRGLLATAMSLAFVPLAQAAPTGGQVTAGSGSIAQSGATTTINQASQNLSLSWQSFNTTAQETVNFVQPSASAIAVNRIYDTNGTQFFGHLNANGQVYLINPNGILFGAGSQVNVGGLVASTLDVSDGSLNNATRSFSGNGTGSVINQGSINGHYVALLGNTVVNQGSIIADGGTAALGAGSAVTLIFADTSLVHMQVDQSTLDNLAGNGGLIRADGGMVLMSAGAKNALLASVVNNAGVIEARSVQNINGTIVLDGGNLGSVSNSGTLDASGKNAGETGGTVKVLGGTVDLLAGSNIDVSGDVGGGTALIGGNFHGAGPEQNASTTTVATGTTINADAISSGDGGNIAVWSDVHTTVDGVFSARGGTNNGNGGLVETSGAKLTVGANTLITTSAPNGKTGEWLLDPNDFTIGCSAFYCGTLIPGDIMDVTLSANLGDGSAGPGTNVTILSSQGATNGNGDITLVANGVSGSAVVAWSATTTLTLSAYRNVNIDGWLDTVVLGGNGSIVLRADNTGTGVGTVNIAPGSYGGGGTSAIFTGGTGSTTIYTNAPSSTNGYKQDNCSTGSYCGVFNVYQLVRADTAGVVNNKTYDGTTTATIGTAFGLVGSPAGATLNAGTAAFADKNAGTGKTVNFSGYSASGTVGMAGGITANYYLAAQPTATADITPKALTLSGLSVAGSKVYDGSTAATVSGTAALQAAEAAGAGTTADGKAYTGDTVSITGTATGTYNSKDVATASSVAYGGLSLTGAQAGNYTLTQGSAAATITAKALTVTATSTTKTYDGTTSAAGSATVGALASGDSVNNAATQAFLDKNAGTNKTVHASGLTIKDGSNADMTGNYSITYADDTTSVINAKALTLSGLSVAASKVYDGTTAAAVSGTAVLQAAEAAGAGTTVDGKAYTGDTVSITGTATGAYNSKDVATASSVNYSGLSLTGAQAGNYTLTQGSAAATITAKALTMSGLSVAASKVYDGTMAATVSGTAALQAAEAAGAGTTADGKAYTGDTVSITGTAAGTYNSKDVATASSVTYGGLSLTGAQAGNYTLTIQGNSAATITAKALTATMTAANKTYDAGTAAAPTFTITGGLIGTETVTATGTATFADKNVANGKTVTANTVALANGTNGGLAGNYTLAAGQTATANITPATLTMSGITASNKVYDATAAATVNTTGAVFTGKLGGDVVTVSATGTFADKNVANGKTVTLTSICGGADAGNYTITDQASTTANITPAALTLGGITASNKVYDATTAATLNTAGVTFSGKIGADVVTLSGTGVGTFADKNVANGKTVTVSGYTLGGADAGNYTVAQPSGLTANITPAALSLSGLTAANKVYDATTVATVNTAGAVYTGKLGGDVVTVSTTGAFADKNVANGKAVTVSVGGADAGNYTVTQQAGLTANITPAALTVSGLTAADKVYDATTVATVNTAGAVYTGKLGGDVVTVNATGVFADKNVANGKTVTLTSTYGGADAGNYTITDQAGTTANITPKALTVTANAASKTYDGTAYFGGNGVTYTGFAGGETAAVLGGTLTYGGTSQGAIDSGTYVITPGGLSSSNYALGYVNGVLTINAQPPAAAPLPAQNAVTQVQANVLPPQSSTQPTALNPSSTITVQQSSGAVLASATQNIGGTGPTLRIVNGGTRLPVGSMFNINDTKEKNL